MSETMYYFWLCGMRCVSSDVPPACAHVELIAEYRPEDDAFISEYIRNGAMSHPRFEPARLDGMLTTIDLQNAEADYFAACRDLASALKTREEHCAHMRQQAMNRVSERYDSDPEFRAKQDAITAEAKRIGHWELKPSDANSRNPDAKPEMIWVVDGPTGSK